MKHAARSARAAWLAVLIASGAGCGGSGSGSDAKSNDTTDTHITDAGADTEQHTTKPRHHYPAVDHDASTGDRPGSGNVGAMDAAVDGGAATDAATATDAADGTDAAPFMPTCPPATLMFEGEVATVADAPLGLDDSVRTTEVSGTFSYLPCIPDQDSDPKRGIYEHPSGGEFTLSVGGLSIEGSGRPRLEVENFDPDTMRWRDGNIPLDDRVRVMRVDGHPAPELEVLIAITDGSGAALSGDAPPTDFPWLDIASFPHTFAVSDADGTLLLHLDTLTQL